MSKIPDGPNDVVIYEGKTIHLLRDTTINSVDGARFLVSGGAVSSSYNVVAQEATAYDVVATDVGKLLYSDNVGAITETIEFLGSPGDTFQVIAVQSIVTIAGGQDIDDDVDNDVVIAGNEAIPVGTLATVICINPLLWFVAHTTAPA